MDRRAKTDAKHWARRTDWKCCADGEISQARASELARMVLRENAQKALRMAIIGFLCPRTFLTPEQYLEIERKAEFKSEYYRGEMVSRWRVRRKATIWWLRTR